MTDDLTKYEPEYDPSQLEAFETPAESKPLVPMNFSLEKHVVAQKMAFEGKSMKKIAEETGIPIHVITKWNKHPDFIKYKQDLVLERAEAMKAQHLSDLFKTLDAKRTKAEDNEDWENFSKKDPTAIMETIAEITNSGNNTEQSNYAKLMEALLEKSQRIKVIQVESDE